MVENINLFISKINYDYIQMMILIFFTYSFIGWCMETIRIFIHTGKLVNRGFLIGPLCPVYGYGVCLVSIFLEKYSNDYIALFVMATVLCGLLEYFTSFIMEKIFNARWWDYSNRKFNINGRVCLENLCAFGILGCLIICIFNPLLIKLYNLVSNDVRNDIVFALLVLNIIDTIISLIIMIKFRKITYTQEDNTEEINNLVKEEVENNVREIKGAIKKTEEHITYTRNIIKENNTKSIRKIKRKISNKREDIEEQIKLTLDEINYRQEKISNDMEKAQTEFKDKINDFKLSSEDKIKNAVESFSKQNFLHRRLIEAFPKMKVTVKNKKNKKRKV